jgi:hypothetical protein
MNVNILKILVIDLPKRKSIKKAYPTKSTYATILEERVKEKNKKKIVGRGQFI